MADESQCRNPMEELIRLWQAWMAAGLDAMQRTATVFASGGVLPEWAAGLREQTEQAVRATLEAARIPSLQDLDRLATGFDALRSNLEAMQTGLTALESVVKAQQEVWRTLEGTLQQAVRVQQETQQAMAAWSKQWEDRMTAVASGLEEWRQRWEEMLRQGMVTSQASQKSLEDLTRTMWGLSKKVMGGQD